ncbi:MAG: hypothetical protein ACK55Z_17865, partial [bacterium]
MHDHVGTKDVMSKEHHIALREWVRARPRLGPRTLRDFEPDTAVEGDYYGQRRVGGGERREIVKEAAFVVI